MILLPDWRGFIELLNDHGVEYQDALAKSVRDRKSGKDRSRLSLYD
jgi:hypothetical protein